MINILNSFSELANNEGITITKLEQIIGASKGVLSRAVANNSDIQSKWILKLVENYPQYSSEWLLTGKGKMLKKDNPDSIPFSKHLIPLYEDVTTIGGSNMVSDMGSIYSSQVLIDLGDLFVGATAAIKHYNDSMIEYKSGSVLGIRELKDKQEIEWGRNYVIETAEMRVTKKIAEIDDEYIMAYSTNNETYPDGRLIHQPIKIKKVNIKTISRVLGSVNLEEFTWS